MEENKIDKKNVLKIMPLSDIQKGILYHCINNKYDNMYKVLIKARITGNFSYNIFSSSLKNVVANNEILRSIFRWRNLNEPIQIVLKDKKIPMEYKKVQDVREDIEIRKMYSKINLDTDPFSILIIQLNNNEYDLYIFQYHILLDGWSNGILLNEIFNIYNESIQNGYVFNQVIQKKSYSNYLKFISNINPENEKNYWKQYLKGFNSKAQLLDRRNPDKYTHENYVKTLDIKLEERLKSFINKKNCTLSTVIYLAWGILLQKYLNINDVIFGTTVSGRNIKLNEIEKMVGLFINTIPFRFNLSRTTSITEAIKYVENTIAERFDHESTSSADIKQYSDINKATSLFDSIVVIENYPININTNPNGLKVSSIESIENSNYELALRIQLSSELKFFYDFNGYTYTCDEIKKVHRHLNNILEDIISNPDKAICNISMLETKEEEEVLCKFNDTKEIFEEDILINELVERQVNKTPFNVAIQYKDKKILYKELDEQSNKLANYLIELGVLNRDLVGILLNRSPYLITSILGIEKAGAAYIPFETNTPLKRIKNILDKVNCKYFITDKDNFNNMHKVFWESKSLQKIIIIDQKSENLEIEDVDTYFVKEFWNHLSKNSNNEIMAGGFISSYTNETFKKEEVVEYQEYVINLIKKYVNKNSNVLEIGCGSGLIMYDVSELVNHYYGLDPSDITQEKNAQIIRNNNYNNIKLLNGFAHEVDKFNYDNKFDVIVISSTIQFFSGYAYLKDVIFKCLKLLNENGVIILSDIMNPNEKENFLKSLYTFKRKNTEAKTKLDIDSEFYVSPQFFDKNLNELFKQCNVNIQYRDNTFNNELKYRYDVIIRKNIKSKNINIKNYKEILLGCNIDRCSSLKPNIKIQSKDLAYIIYTSGSTGEPKGVAVTHKSVINLIEWLNKKFNISENDTILFIASIAFDLSVYDIFGILATGGCINIVDTNEVMNPKQLAKYLCYNEITLLNSTPAMIGQIVKTIDNEALIDESNTLRLILMSGDWIPIKLPKKIKNIFKKAKTISLGGATEATVWSNYYEINEINPNWISIPYGKPINNAKYYILDDYLNPCPIGVRGNLYIGGTCLAKEYINDAELSNRKFINNPFCKGEKIYNTGDCARWFPDGNIEFLGRCDLQVKIRGYRIELGEIEFQLLKYVKEVIVIDIIEESEKVLCAYFVSDHKISANSLREKLLSELPNYMVPTYFIQLDKIPITYNGKVDRKHLPKPIIKFDNRNDEYLGEKVLDSTKKKLVEIWGDILNIKNIRINDNFFDLGGHSLKAISIISRIQKDLGVTLKIDTIMNYPTIKELGEYIDNNCIKENEITIDDIKVNKDIKIPLSTAQKRMFYLNAINPNSLMYNISGGLIVNEKVNLEKLKNVINFIMKKHNILRTGYRLEKNDICQFVIDDTSLLLEYRDGDLNSIDSIFNEFIKPFDLLNPPLIRFLLINLNNEKFMLGMDMHHIAADDISVNILKDDFINLYLNNKSYNDSVSNYSNYSLWENKFLKSDNFKKQEEFWLRTFNGYYNLLKEKISLNVKTDSSSIKFILNDSDLLYTLNHIMINTKSTKFTVLYSICSLILSNYFNVSDIVIGALIDGRTEEFSKTVGMFVQTLAIRNIIPNDSSLIKYIKTTRDNIFNSFENRNYPLEMLISNLNLNRNLSNTNDNPLIDIIISYKSLENKIHDDAKLSVYISKNQNAKFPLLIDIYEKNDSLEFNFDYRKDVFKENDILNIYEGFITILRYLRDDENKIIKNIKILEEENGDVFDFS